LALDTILQVEIILVVIGIGVGFWMLNKKIHRMFNELKKYETEIDLDSQLSDIFSENNQKKSYELGHKMMNYLKRKFKLHSNSYSDMIEEVKKKKDMDDALKEYLVDLFQDMIIISYKTDLISKDERDNLKKKIKMVIKRIESA